MMIVGLVLSNVDDVVKARIWCLNVRLPNTTIRTSGRNNHLLKLELLEKQTTEPIKYRICFVYWTGIHQTRQIGMG
jgi:hypothetical protein